MDFEPIRYGITIFSGFLQSLGSPGSGFVGIEHEAYILACGRPDVRVRLFPWNTDENDVAESLWRYRPRENGKSPVQVHIVLGYSYGGDRAIKFCKALEKRGDCSVKELWLCDAVRRWDYLPGVAAAFGLGSIRIPKIVEKCTYYVQRNPRWSFRSGFFQPAGHHVLALDQKTTLLGPRVREESHSYIDNDNTFRLEVIQSIRNFLRETR